MRHFFVQVIQRKGLSPFARWEEEVLREQEEAETPLRSLTTLRSLILMGKATIALWGGWTVLSLANVLASTLYVVNRVSLLGQHSAHQSYGRKRTVTQAATRVTAPLSPGKKRWENVKSPSVPQARQAESEALRNESQQAYWRSCYRSSGVWQYKNCHRRESSRGRNIPTRFAPEDILGSAKKVQQSQRKAADEMASSRDKIRPQSEVPFQFSLSSHATEWSNQPSFRAHAIRLHPLGNTIERGTAGIRWSALQLAYWRRLLWTAPLCTLQGWDEAQEWACLQQAHWHPLWVCWPT